MSSDDDTAYKQLFAHPEMVRDLLLGFVPGEWIRQLDFSSCERVNGSYISDGGDHRHSDMVWRVRLAGELVYLYLLLEFQSCPDPWMALRMQVHVGLLYQDLAKRGELPEPGHLPPVLPVVLYTGRLPWRAKMNLCQLVMSVPENLQHLQAEQSYLLFDLQHMTPESLQNNLVFALVELESARTERALLTAVLRLRKAATTKHSRELVHTVGQWSLLRLQRLAKKHRIELSEKGMEDVMTAAMRKVFMDGARDGLKLLCHRERFEMILRQRYRRIPKEVQDRIDSSEMKDLDLWFRRLFDARTIKEIFSDSQQA